MRSAAILCATVALVATFSVATTVRRLSMQQIVDASHLIVLGRVGRSVSRWNPQHNVIFTYTTIHPEEFWKGSTDQRELTIRQWGGAAEGVRMHVPGVPLLIRGSERVFFLEPVRGENAWMIVGLSQGQMTVHVDASGARYVSSESARATVDLRTHTYTTDGPVHQELAGFRDEVQRRSLVPRANTQ